MKIIQRVIYTGFAAVTIASASMPVFPDHTAMHRAGTPDFQWYADVGKPLAPLYPVVIVNEPPARDGYIWSPGHWEWDGQRHVWKQAHWVRDDYAEQLALHNPGARTLLAEGGRSQVFIERR